MTIAEGRLFEMSSMTREGFAWPKVPKEFVSKTSSGMHTKKGLAQSLGEQV